MFDTGADGATLLHNMKELGINLRCIGIIVISHAHGDRTGGLLDILEVNRDAEVYVPASYRARIPGRKVIEVIESIQISEGFSLPASLKVQSSPWRSRQAKVQWWW